MVEIAHQKHSLVHSHLDINRAFSQITAKNIIGLYTCNPVSNIKVSASFTRIVFANLFIYSFRIGVILLLSTLTILYLQWKSTRFPLCEEFVITIKIYFRFH
jgi:hypothetical protein